MSLSKVAFGRTMSEDEVDLDSGFLMMPAAIPVPEPVAVAPETDTSPPPTQGTQQPERYPSTGLVVPPPTVADTAARSAVRIRFTASRDQVFKSFGALANLADRSDGGKVQITVEATSAEGYDPAWYRNAVEEPLDEADIDGLRVE